MDPLVETSKQVFKVVYGFQIGDPLQIIDGALNLALDFIKDQERISDTIFFREIYRPDCGGVRYMDKSSAEKYKERTLLAVHRFGLEAKSQEDRVALATYRNHFQRCFIDKKIDSEEMSVPDYPPHLRLEGKEIVREDFSAKPISKCLKQTQWTPWECYRNLRSTREWLDAHGKDLQGMLSAKNPDQPKASLWTK